MFNSHSWSLLAGLADRIIGFATTFMIAFLTGRAFQMGRRRELPILEKAFESPFINWTREQDPDWLLEPLKLKVDRRNYNESVLASKEYWAVNTLDDWRFQDRLIREDLSVLMGGDTQTTLMVSNRGKTIRMFENLHYQHRLTKIGLTPYTAFGCMTNYLIQPRPEIFLPVAKQFEFMSRNQSDVLKISIQVRVGDWAWADKDHQTTTKNFKYFFRCARAIEAWAMAKGNYSDVKWYLATESMPLRQAAVKAWGDKVVTSLNTTIEHSAKESSVCNGGADADHKAAVGCDVTDPGFLAAAAEWWMIGYADYHVVTRWSGYGRSGAFRTITSNSLYTIHDTHVTCSEDNYSPLDEIMYDWSGI